MMSPSDQLSSSIDSSLSNTGKCAPCHLFNPVEYISRLFWTQIIQYRLCSCLDNSSSPSFHCLLNLDVPCPDEKTLFLRFLTRACLETASFCFPSLLALLPMSLPRGRRSQHQKSALFLLSLQFPLSSSTSSHLCGAASCSCELELLSGTTLPVGTGHPCGTVIAWCCKSLLN